jgi:hypothetical protein
MDKVELRDHPAIRVGTRSARHVDAACVLPYAQDLALQLEALSSTPYGPTRRSWSGSATTLGMDTRRRMS